MNKFLQFKRTSADNLSLIVRGAETELGTLTESEMEEILGDLYQAIGYMKASIKAEKK